MLLSIRLRHLGNIGIALALVVGTACRPKNQEMLVAYVQGDIFLPHITPQAWNLGETKECQIASLTSQKPDDRGDLLLCGYCAQLGWSQIWLRRDIEDQIYSSSLKKSVRFHSIGHDRGSRNSDPWWKCQKNIDGIDCD